MSFFLPFFFVANSIIGGAMDVPIRADLGVEVCQVGGTLCQKTPFSGENVLISLKQVKETPETWEGDWNHEVNHQSLTFKGSVKLKIEATPQGYSFLLTAAVDGSETNFWFDNLGQLKHTEIRGRQTHLGNEFITPYLYLSQPYKN